MSTIDFFLDCLFVLLLGVNFFLITLIRTDKDYQQYVIWGGKILFTSFFIFLAITCYQWFFDASKKTNSMEFILSKTAINTPQGCFLYVLICISILVPTISLIKKIIKHQKEERNEQLKNKNEVKKLRRINKSNSNRIEKLENGYSFVMNNDQISQSIKDEFLRICKLK